MRTETGEQALVSVLTPVFNAERYLEECLQSAVGQSLESLEIICVDDGSTDRSGAIIQQFRQSDDRIKMFRHVSNRGEGAARNTAIDRARGRFVFHLDADDLLPEGSLERLCRVAVEHGSQMVKGAYSTITAGGQFIERRLQASRKPTFNTCLQSSGFLQRIPVSHCSYLYDRDFLNEHGLRYRSDLKVGLDIVALTECLVAASRVSVLPEEVYLYRQSGVSVTRGTITPAIVLNGMDAKRLVSLTLARAGLADAAARVLRTWGWQINALWANLDPDTPPETIRRLFGHFRDIVPRGFVPWTKHTPLSHRFILAAVMLGPRRRRPQNPGRHA